MIMKKAAYFKWILGTEAVGLLSGFLSRRGMEDYGLDALQPGFAPPAAVFPAAWTVLYALMGIGAARIWTAEDSPDRKRGLNLFVAQLTVNFFWSLIFFNLRTYGIALLWLLLLWGLVLAMLLTFRKTDPPAAWLQIPYLVWLTFAAVLNYAVWQLNR